MEVVEDTAIGEAELCAWAAGALVAAGTREADAAQIARCLVDVDLRGVKSHGTRQLPGYIQLLLAGEINPAPEIRTLRESDSSIRLDGGGGAGYLAAAKAVDAACAKARACGLALASTCNHGHTGSAGIWARRALEHGLICWCVAGGTAPLANIQQKLEDPEATVWNAMSAPPMAFAVPSDEGGPPLVLDMNANQFSSAGYYEGELAEKALAAGFGKSVFGSLGLRFVSTLLGGELSATLPEGTGEWSAATRGLVFVAIDPDLIGDGDAFRASVRQIIDESLRLPPMRGTDEAALPGTMEYRRENERRVGGIPMPEDHREMLEGVAAELGVAPPPWAARPRL